MAETSLATVANDSGLLDTVARYLNDGDLVQAIALAEREITQNQSIQAVCALSAIAFHQNNIASAISLLESVVDMVSGDSDIPEALAVLNCLAGRVTEALFYGKLATAIAVKNDFLPLYGASFPRYADAFLGIEHKPLLRRARERFEQGDYADATQWVEQHLQLFRDDVEGLDHYAQCLIATQRYDTAVGVLRSVVTLGGPSATLYGRMGQALVAQGEFDAGMACHQQAVCRGPKAAVLWAAMLADWAYCPWGEPPAQARTQAGLDAAIAAAGPKVARKAPPAEVRPKLTIGILCNAPRNDEQRAMIAAVARGFDRQSVTIIGYGPGDLGDATNMTFRGAFTTWRNTNKVDELTLAAVIRGDRLDVLLDADGLAARERLGLFARHAAPLQYSWLNMPVGGVLPGGHGHMGGAGGPACGMVVLPKLSGPVMPAPSVGGAQPITFGADVSLAELSPEVARVWSSILHAFPDATLALVDRGFTDPKASARLIDLFGNFGVAHRVDVLSQAEPAEFFANVDVALAPFPMTRPVPYGLGLSAGIPVVVMADMDRSGLAGAIGTCGEVASQLLAQGADDYVAKAVALASDADALIKTRQVLHLTVGSALAFSEVAFAAEWERFFRAALADAEKAQG